MNFLHSLGGMVLLEVTCGDPEAFLLTLQNAGITLYGAERLDALRIRFQISRGDYGIVQKLGSKKGAELILQQREGIYWMLKALKRRPVLLLGLTLLLVFSLWVPGRVFFVQVEGNSSIPAAKIIEKAQTCGIGFGASRRQVRSEHMKNELLNAMPELGWAGVNTYGCVAVITVRERTDPEISEKRNQVSSIVALRDGIVWEMTVLQGSAQCKPGDAVKAGQILISGYTDCGLQIQATQAQGEVYAQTRRQITTLYPTDYTFRGQKKVRDKKYSLIIGKKRINFEKGSGISGSSCAKIKSVYYMALPGGFQLPIALEVEAFLSYGESACTGSPDEDTLKNFTADYLLQQMIAGKISSKSEVITQMDGLLRLDGSYICTEMIGMQRIEENLQVLWEK